MIECHIFPVFQAGIAGDTPVHMIRIIRTGGERYVVPLIEAIFKAGELLRINAKAPGSQIAVLRKPLSGLIVVFDMVAPPLAQADLLDHHMSCRLDGAALTMNLCFISGQHLLVGNDLDIAGQRNPARLLIDLESISRTLKLLDTRLHVQQGLNLGRDLSKATPGKGACTHKK